ncbi:MAG: DUF6514 family protein [Faecalibacterium sp.]
MIKYRAEKEAHCCPDTGVYTAWGIKAYQVSGDEQIIVAYIPDVFLCKKEADDFAFLCSQLHLELCHLDDVVEDYLSTI